MVGRSANSIEKQVRILLALAPTYLRSRNLKLAIVFSPIEQCAVTQPFVECHGVDLSRDLDCDTVAQVKGALLTHGLVLFREQTELTPQREVVFNRAFGWHDAEQCAFVFGFGAPESGIKVSGGAQIPSLPEVSVLGNVMLDDYHGIRNTQLRSGARSDLFRLARRWAA